MIDAIVKELRVRTFRIFLSKHQIGDVFAVDLRLWNLLDGIAIDAMLRFPVELRTRVNGIMRHDVWEVHKERFVLVLPDELNGFLREIPGEESLIRGQLDDFLVPEQRQML